MLWQLTVTPAGPLAYAPPPPQTLALSTPRGAFQGHPCFFAALDKSQYPSSALRFPVSLSLEGLTLGLAGSGEARRSRRHFAHLHGRRPPRQHLLDTFPYLQEES